MDEWAGGSDMQAKAPTKIGTLRDLKARLQTSLRKEEQNGPRWQQMRFRGFGAEFS